MRSLPTLAVRPWRPRHMLLDGKHPLRTVADVQFSKPRCTQIVKSFLLLTAPTSVPASQLLRGALPLLCRHLCPNLQVIREQFFPLCLSYSKLQSMCHPLLSSLVSPFVWLTPSRAGKSLAQTSPKSSSLPGSRRDLSQHLPPALVSCQRQIDLPFT